MNYFCIEVENMYELKPKLYEEIKKRNISPDRVVILSKKPVRKKGFLGIGSKMVYEVWFQILDQENNNNQKVVEPNQKQNTLPINQDMTSPLYKEIETLKKMIQEVMIENKKIKEITTSYLKAKEANFDMLRKQMIEKDFPIGFVDRIIERIDSELTEDEKQNFYVIYDRVKAMIASDIKVASTELVISKKPKIVILVGPTGVGKTTTIVKLALLWAATKGRKFAFFSLDKYKAGASFQLKSFAEIFKVPMKSIRNEEELKESLSLFSDNDIIFVDTAGTSQKDTLTINDLKDHVKILKKFDVWISLVMSAVTKYKDMLDIINRYSVVGYNNIILSKIDETNTLGSSVAALCETQVPLSFVTNGQRVEADITTLRPMDLVYMALDERRDV